MSEDYVMRLLRQMGAVLAGILAKKKAGNIVEARQEIESKCRETIGMSLAQLKQLSPEAIAHLVKETGAARYLRAVTLAELFLLDADISETLGEMGHVSSNDVHAFCLLADSIDALGAEEQKIYRVKLDLLADRLGALRSHPYIAARLRDYGSGNNS